MALLWHDGFESGNCTAGLASPTADYQELVFSGPSATVPYSYGRSGSFPSNGVIAKAFPPTNRMFVGFAYREGANHTSDWLLFRGDANATTHITLRWVNSATLGVYRGGTLIASGAAVEPTATGVWIYVEVGINISDTVGNVEVRVEGSTILNFTGDTKNAGTNNSIDYVKFQNPATTSFIDDLYVCDDTGSDANTFLGPKRVYTLAPTAAGSSTQWTPSTGANWAAVDEQPYNASDFITGSTSGFRDLYTISDLPTSVSNVKGLRVGCIAKKSDAGVIAFKNSLRSGGTNYAGASQSPSTTDCGYSSLWPTNPATGSAWTTSGINAIEAGVEVA